MPKDVERVMPPSRLKAIRTRHAKFKRHCDAKPWWKAEISVQDVDFLLDKIERLKAKARHGTMPTTRHKGSDKRPVPTAQ